MSANGVISLALDTDTKWNGNEKWIEIDERDRGKRQRFVHLRSVQIRPGHILRRRIHVRYSGEISYLFAPHLADHDFRNVQFRHYNTAYFRTDFRTDRSDFGNVLPRPIRYGHMVGSQRANNGVISLAWIPTPSGTAMKNGSKLTAWPPQMATVRTPSIRPDSHPGTYYVGGYMYDTVAKTATYSHLTSAPDFRNVRHHNTTGFRADFHIVRSNFGNILPRPTSYDYVDGRRTCLPTV